VTGGKKATIVDFVTTITGGLSLATAGTVIAKKIRATVKSFIRHLQRETYAVIPQLPLSASLGSTLMALRAGI